MSHIQLNFRSARICFQTSTGRKIINRIMTLAFTAGSISMMLPVYADNAELKPVVAQKTSRAYLQKFTCPTDPAAVEKDCFLYFQPFDVGGMTIQAVCNDCFLQWQQSRNNLSTIDLNNRVALIRVDLQPYRDTGKNWYVVKWFTLIK